MSRRTVTLIVAALLLVGFVVAAAVLPVPYVSLGPGPVFNTIGSYDGKALITVTGTTVYPTTGRLDMTTVSETGGPYGRLGLGQALQGWIDPHTAVIPTRLLYPPGQSSKQVEQQNEADFSDAESSATVAAFTYLGIPFATVVQVQSVDKTGPAAGVLEPGDTIVAVNGTATKDIPTARSVIGKISPGRTVQLTVKRKGVTKTVPVVTGSSRAGGRLHAVIGVTLTTGFYSKVKVSYGLSGVGGPSAGLMFTLGLVDKLTPGAMTDGTFIAGTGTIDDNGNVGPIGGIQQKMQGARSAGATLFLVPKDNCATAKGAVPHGLRIVKVTSLKTAIDVIEAVHAGRATPTC